MHEINSEPGQTIEKLELVVPVESPNAGSVFTTSRKVLLMILTLSFLVIFFAGPLAVIVGAVNLVVNDSIIVNLSDSMAVSMIVGGVFYTILGGYICLYGHQALLGLVYGRLIRRSIADREEALINPKDPEAVYVKWVPRDQWHEIRLDDAADIGLLYVDRIKQTLYFEGDSTRHTIPGELIVSCDVEYGGYIFEPFNLVVLKLPEGCVDVPELCYEYKQPRGILSRWIGRRRAMDLKSQIDLIVAAAPSQV